MESAHSPGTPRRSRPRRLAYALIAAGLAAGVLLGLGIFPHEPLRRAAEAALRRAVGPGSRLGGLSVTPLLLRVDVRDLRLEGDGFVLTIPRGRMELAPRALASRAPLLRSLDLESPRLEMRPMPAAPATPAEETTTLPPLAVRRFTLRDGRVAWKAGEGGELDVEDLKATGSIGTGSLELRAASIFWRGETPLRIEPAIARLAVTSELDTNLEALDLRLGPSRLAARGPLLRRGRLEAALQVDAHVDLADAGPRIGAPDLSGTLAVDGRIEGSLESVQASARLTGAAGRGDWHATDIDARVSAEPATGRLEARVDAATLGGRLRGRGRLEGETTDGELHARDLDLDRLPGAKGSGRPAGRMDVDLAWNGSLRDLAWSARVTGDSVAPVTAAVRLDAEGRLLATAPLAVAGHVAGQVDVAAGPSPIAVPVEGRFEIAGETRSAHLDARGSLRATADVSLRGDRIETGSVRVAVDDLSGLLAHAAGHVDIETEIGGTTARPSLSLRASGEALAWKGAPVGAATARLDGDLEQADVRLTIPDLSIDGEGEIRLGPSPRLRGELRGHRTPLGPLGRLAGFAAAPEGHLTVSVRQDLPLAAPMEAEVTADVAELEVEREGRTLRAAPFRAVLRDGRARVDSLAVEGPGLHLEARADAGLEPAAPLAIDVSLRGELGDLPLPDGWALSGSVEGRLAVEGTREKPRLEGTVRLAAVSARLGSLPPISLDEAALRFGDDRLRIEPLALTLGTARLTVSGEVPYAAAWPALRGDALSEFEEARISVRGRGVAPGALGGEVSGQLTVEGGLASLLEPRAVLVLDGSRLGPEALSVTLQPSTLRLESGRVTTDGITLRSDGGDLLLTGGADLGAGTLDVKGEGNLALGLLSPLVEYVSLEGTAEVDLALEGSLAAPATHGIVRVSDVSVRLRDIPQALTGASGELRFDGTTAEIDATGELGGGAVRLGGSAALAGGALDRVRLALTGSNVALRYPPGLRARLDLDVTLDGRPGGFSLKGDVDVEGGVYEIETAVKEALRAAPASGDAELLRTVALDVTVRVDRPVVVRSAFGRLEATGRITARGDASDPLPYGRLVVRRGGRIDVQGREFTVADGSLSYAGDWNAELALAAEADIRGIDEDFESGTDYRVRVALAGSMDEPSLTLTSDPGLSQQEIVSLIATGRLRSPLVDSSAWFVGGQAATLLSEPLTRGVAQTFGLDEITVRPDLVARETDPSARFTFGKRLGRRLGLVYSAGLGGPETRFVELEARPGRDVTLRAQRTDDGSFALGAGQRFEWGAAAAPQSALEPRVRLDGVRFEGSPIEETLRRSVRLAQGRRVTEWRVEDEAERLRSRLRSQGHLEAEATGRIEGHTAVLSIEPGPVYELRVEGLDDPPDLAPVLEEALFEADALDLARERLLRSIHRDGHLRARVSTRTVDEGGRRVLVFAVEPGPRFGPVSVSFPGAEALDERTLLEAAGGAAGLLERPEAATRAIVDAYRARSFLTARVEPPRVDTSGGAATIVVGIEEGEPARLADLRFEGVTLPEEDLRQAASLEPGILYSADEARAAVGRVRGLYLSRGFAEVRVRPELVEEGSDLALVMGVEEGERHLVDSIGLEGNTRTRSSLVERALRLEPGDPIDPRRLADAERRLLSLGTFSRAAIVPEPDDPSALRVEVREAAHLTAAYDLRWDDEAGASALVEGEASNLLGLGLALGGRFRFGGEQRELRGTLHAPAALVGGDLTGSVFRTERDFDASGLTITRIQKGFQLQHSLRPSRGWEILTGYRFRRNLTVAESLPEIPIDVGGLSLSLVRTTWDDLLDPRHGLFASSNLEVAPDLLGTDAPLLKTYTQVGLVHSFAGERLTWAQSGRLGLAWGLDGEPVISGERFGAGGATSLRGFGTNEVGPRGPLGDPAGGQAVVIVNEELRYRHPSGLGAVVFYDVGNVFARVEDMRFDLRHTLGAGLRWASPIGLLRVDLGFPLDRQPEEKRYRVFFGLGQAF